MDGLLLASATVAPEPDAAPLKPTVQTDCPPGDNEGGAQLRDNESAGGGTTVMVPPELVDAITLASADDTTTLLSCRLAEPLAMALS
jgi:hypothetical protein